MQLQALPQTARGFLRISGADQQIQRSAVLLQQVGGDMGADVSGGTSQEYRHVAPAQKAIVKSIQRIMSPLPLRKTPLVRAERNLEKVEKLIKLFEPFILHNEHDFAADNVEGCPTRCPKTRRPRSAITRDPLIGGITGSISTFRRCASGPIL